MVFNHILLFFGLKHTNVLGFAMRQEAVAHLSQDSIFSGSNIKIMEVKHGRTSHRKNRIGKIILHCTKDEETIFNLHNCRSLSSWLQPLPLSNK